MSQAALLAQRDSLTPFRVVFATSAVSLLGDFFFIGRLGMGVVGAAWTTLLAQASTGGGGMLPGPGVNTLMQLPGCLLLFLALLSA